MAAVPDVNLRGVGQSPDSDLSLAIPPLPGPESYHHVELPVAKVVQDLLPAYVFQRDYLNAGQLPEAAHGFNIRRAENRQGRFRVELPGQYLQCFGTDTPHRGCLGEQNSGHCEGGLPAGWVM